MGEYFVSLSTATPGSLILLPVRYCSLVTRGAVSRLLRDSLRVSGLPCQSLEGHSFRIGTASVATGLPDWLIKVMGSWYSDCYQRYMKTPQSTLESVAPRMANVVEPFSSN